jgi:hypothetical protein
MVSRAVGQNLNAIPNRRKSRKAKLSLDPGAGTRFRGGCSAGGRSYALMLGCFKDTLEIPLSCADVGYARATATD